MLSISLVSKRSTMSHFFLVSCSSHVVIARVFFVTHCVQERSRRACALTNRDENSTLLFFLHRVAFFFLHLRRQRVVIWAIIVWIRAIISLAIKNHPSSHFNCFLTVAVNQKSSSWEINQANDQLALTLKTTREARKEWKMATTSAVDAGLRLARNKKSKMIWRV